MKGAGGGGMCIMDKSSHGKVKPFSATRIRTCILAVTDDLLIYLSLYPGGYSIHYI